MPSALFSNMRNNFTTVIMAPRLSAKDYTGFLASVVTFTSYIGTKALPLCHAQWLNMQAMASLQTLDGCNDSIQHKSTYKKLQCNLRSAVLLRQRDVVSMFAQQAGYIASYTAA